MSQEDKCNNRLQKNSKEDDLPGLLNKIQKNLLDDVDDLDDQISELKGILNETLGDLPFKFGILLVVFSNFIYISYDGISAASTGSIHTSECYCHATDMIFYRIILVLSTILWTLFLSIYAIYSSCGHVVCSCQSRREIKAEKRKHVSKAHKDLLSLLNVLKKRKKYYQAQLEDLVTTKFLDDDHCESIRHHYYDTSIYCKTSNMSSGSTADPSSKACESVEQSDHLDQCAQSGSEPVHTAGCTLIGLEHGQDYNIQDSTVPNNNTQKTNTSASANIVDVVVDIESTGSRQAIANIKGTAHVDSEQHCSNTVNPASSIDPAHDGEEKIVCLSSVDLAFTTESVKPTSGIDTVHEGDEQSTLSKRWHCFMFCKITLLGFRFVFRLLIVPLLQFQLFDDYAWYCVLNNVVRNYCETETNKYYIGLDHSLVNYCVYLILLVALLISLLINWFPKGIPQVVLQYKVMSMQLKKNRWFQSQFGYKPLQNEPATDVDS